MNIPTEVDWRSEVWGIDTPNAYGNFFGKDRQEAFQLFVENAIHYQEDVMFMPVICFRYYIFSYMNYLLSNESKDDSDGANCFFGLIEIRADDILESEPSLAERISYVLLHLKDKQEWYDADESIYGSFITQADDCLKKIRKI